MKKLIKQLNSIPKDIQNTVKSRLSEFKSFKEKSNDDWFSELCFCILTANSRAKTALAIQKELGFNGFSKLSREKIRDSIKNNKHRFHNNKAKYIIQAREHLQIKGKLIDLINEQGIIKARNWIAENINGLGYKEASHFLRNVGFDGIAILDRHIINLMVENNILKEKPLSLTKKNYPQIEKTFLDLAEKVNISPAELDLFMWYLKAGEVLK